MKVSVNLLFKNWKFLGIKKFQATPTTQTGFWYLFVTGTVQDFQEHFRLFYVRTRPPTPTPQRPPPSPFGLKDIEINASLRTITVH